MATLTPLDKRDTFLWTLPCLVSGALAGSFLYENLGTYFFPEIYFSTGYRYSLTHLVPPGTLKGIVTYVVLFVVLWLGLTFMTKPLTKSRGTKPSVKLFALGFLGSFALMRLFGFFKTDMISTIRFFGIDRILSGHQDSAWYAVPGPSDYSVTLDVIGPAIVGMTEELTYGILLVFALRRLSVGYRSAICIIVILRGLLHLHIGTVFAILFLAPLGIFASLYIIRTGRFAPIVISHGIFNLLLGLTEIPSFQTSFFMNGRASLLSLGTAVGILLIVAAISYDPALKGREEESSPSQRGVQD